MCVSGIAWCATYSSLDRLRIVVDDGWLTHARSLGAQLCHAIEGHVLLNISDGQRCSSLGCFELGIFASVGGGRGKALVSLGEGEWGVPISPSVNRKKILLLSLVSLYFPSNFARKTTSTSHIL